MLIPSVVVANGIGLNFRVEFFNTFTTLATGFSTHVSNNIVAHARLNKPGCARFHENSQKFKPSCLSSESPYSHFIFQNVSCSKFSMRVKRSTTKPNVGN